MDVVLYQAAHVGKVEVVAKAVHGALHILMAVLVHDAHDLQEQGRCRWNVEAGVEGHHAVDQGLG